MFPQLLCSVSLLASVGAQSIAFATLEPVGSDGGPPLQYAVVKPADFDPTKEYPVLLALPPGPQNKEMVEAGLNRYWGELAAAQGWVVFSPVAPAGTTFFKSDGHLVLARLLDHVRTTVRVDGGRLYLAGASNGGRSAFKVALEWPFEFHNMTVLPGYADNSDLSRLDRLQHITVQMFVGGDDANWVARGQETVRAMGQRNVPVLYSVLPGEGHVPESLDGGAVMERLESLRQSVPDRAATEQAVHDALDDFHDAACKGDEVRYFGRFTDDAVFLGTDPAERWDLAAFKDYALRYFERPSAWIYVPSARNVTVAPNGQTAWFDEVVTNRSYGDCRGSGVLRMEDSSWRLCQYNLSVPIPNDLTRSVVADIRAHAVGALPLQGVTLIAVRHAEKESGKDPGLTEAGQARAERLAAMLSALPVRAVLSSPYKRTMATAQPLCDALGLELQTPGAKDYAAMGEQLRNVEPGGVVVMVGHSNTVPELLQFLGVADVPKVEEGDYDHLFVARFGARPALLDLRY